MDILLLVLSLFIGILISLIFVIPIEFLGPKHEDFLKMAGIQQKEDE